MTIGERFRTERLEDARQMAPRLFYLAKRSHTDPRRVEVKSERGPQQNPQANRGEHRPGRAGLTYLVSEVDETRGF